MSIESDNAKGEIKEIVEKCIRCGLCKEICPVLRILRNEQNSPRGRTVILDEGFVESIVFDCTLCKACEVNCPLNLKLCTAFIKARQILVSQKKGIEKNEEILKNINKTGNIFGEIE